MTSPSRARRTVRRTARHHIGLGVFLGALKDRCRLTFAELAARTAELEDTTAVSASTLKRALYRGAVPQEHVVTAYVRACGATAEEERDALKLWRAARAEDRGILASLRAPSVTSIRTSADLDAALAAAYERAGAPPLRVLQLRAATDEADGALLLPLTTAWRITRREGRPANWTQCEAFLRACGIHPRRMRPWQEAFQRTQAPDQTERATPAGRGPRWWTGRHHLYFPSTQNCPVCDKDLTTPKRPAAADRTGNQQQAAGAPTPTRALTATLNRLLSTQARRNGTAPDTDLDAIAVADGTIHLFECKHQTDPGAGSASAPRQPRPSAPARRTNHASRIRQVQPT
ncbi:helix-turn-helix domain-containing protein [Streptomyces plumbiresistens]|uniref:Uncharacterized protein n=1 Tax=Streptomyces plumbiresistens TaxID=511811 RepID=A0ABP7TJN1_9ACTN